MNSEGDLRALDGLLFELGRGPDEIDKAFVRRVMERIEAPARRTVVLRAVAAALLLGLGIAWLVRPTDPPATRTVSGSVEQLLTLEDGSQVRLHPDSEIFLQRDGARLVAGAATFKIAPRPAGRTWRVTTVLGDVIVVGTEFDVKLENAAMAVAVFTGVVHVQNSHGSVIVEAGQDARAQEGTAPVRVDAMGDPLPARALVRLGSSRFRGANCLAYSPDGKFLAAGNVSDSTIVILEATTGKEIRRTSPHDRPVGKMAGVISLAWSPDGAWIASSSYDLTIRISESATGKLVAKLACDGEDVPKLSFSPDGKRLAAAGRNGAVVVHEIASGKTVRRIETRGGGVPLAFSRDGGMLALGFGSGELQVWDLATAAKKVELSAHLNTPTFASFSGDGTSLVSGDGTHSMGMGGPGRDRTLRVWDLASGKELLKISGEKITIETNVGPPMEITTGGVAGAFSPDGREFAMGTESNSIVLCDAKTGKGRLELRGYDGMISGVTYSPDGSTVAAAIGFNSIAVWDRATGRAISAQPGHRERILAVCISPDGRSVVTGGEDRTVRVWDAATGKETAQLTNHWGGIKSCAFSPDGTRLATTGWRPALVVWDLATRAPSTRVGKADDTMTQALFSKDGAVVVTLGQGIQFWDAATGAEIKKPGAEHAQGVSQLVLSPDRTKMVYGDSNGATRFADVETGKVDRTIQAGRGAFFLALSPEGDRMAVAVQKRVHVFDLASGREECGVGEGGAWVLGVAFSPDGRFLASLDSFGRMRLWEIASGTSILTLEGCENSFGKSMAFTPDGRAIAVGMHDGTLVVWDVRPRIESSSRSFEEEWMVLSGPDGAKAFEAAGHLGSSPGKIREKLLPAKSPDIGRLVTELDSEDVSVRDRAAAELAKLGPAAGSALQKAMEAASSEDVKSRLAGLLEEMDRIPMPPLRLAGHRAIAVLERAGTAEARDILRQVVREGSTPRERREAAAALSRMK